MRSPPLTPRGRVLPRRPSDQAVSDVVPECSLRWQLFSVCRLFCLAGRRAGGNSGNATSSGTVRRLTWHDGVGLCHPRSTRYVPGVL